MNTDSITSGREVPCECLVRFKNQESPTTYIKHSLKQPYKYCLYYVFLNSNENSEHKRAAQQEKLIVPEPTKLNPAMKPGAKIYGSDRSYIWFCSIRLLVSSRSLDITLANNDINFMWGDDLFPFNYNPPEMIK